MYLYYMPVMPNQLKENINRIKSLISEFYPDDTPDEPGYTGFPLEDGVEPNKVWNVLQILRMLQK